jgi:Dehydrogenases with different specificities (related to short-chain alcohol dehydrogenases)
MNKIDLNNKVAIVTGGAQGFGLAITKRFVDSGCRVVIWDKDEKILKNLHLDNIIKIKVDITDFKDIENAFSQTLDQVSTVDILINNAGIAGPSYKTWEYPNKDWQNVLDVDVNGVFYCCKTYSTPT